MGTYAVIRRLLVEKTDPNEIPIELIQAQLLALTTRFTAAPCVHIAATIAQLFDALGHHDERYRTGENDEALAFMSRYWRALACPAARNRLHLH